MERFLTLHTPPKVSLSSSKSTKLIYEHLDLHIHQCHLGWNLSLYNHSLAFAAFRDCPHFLALNFFANASVSLLTVTVGTLFALRKVAISNSCSKFSRRPTTWDSFGEDIPVSIVEIWSRLCGCRTTHTVDTVEIRWWGLGEKHIRVTIAEARELLPSPERLSILAM